MSRITTVTNLNKNTKNRMKYVLNQKMQAIENGHNKKRQLSNDFNKHYICKLCGEYCDCILIAHAEKHGYKTKKEFLDSGNLVAV